MELGEDVGDVCLDGGLRDIELFGDLGVGESPGDLDQYLELALGQLIEPFDFGCLRPLGELCDEALGH